MRSREIAAAQLAWLARSSQRCARTIAAFRSDRSVDSPAASRHLMTFLAIAAAAFDRMLVSGCTCTAERLHAPLDGSPGT